MRKGLLWLAPIGLAAGAASRLRRRKRAPKTETETVPDPRAEELKQRLDESREIVSEREEFEAGETPIDTVEDRRRTVHEQARGAIDDMGSQSSDA
jgi:hypothetical protein